MIGGWVLTDKGCRVIDLDELHEQALKHPDLEARAQICGCKECRGAWLRSLDSAVSP
jgi:hypothetical protein